MENELRATGTDDLELVKPTLEDVLGDLRELAASFLPLSAASFHAVRWMLEKGTFTADTKRVLLDVLCGAIQ